MTEDQIEKYRQAAITGSLPDEENSLLLFQGTQTSMLIKIIRNEIDISALIKFELGARGLDENGKWIGFNAGLKSKPTFEGKINRARKKSRGSKH